MFAYIALNSGTLNNPYRFVEAGQRVVSAEPIKAGWLMEEEEYRRTRRGEPVPVFSTMPALVQGRRKAGASVPDLDPDDPYAAQMAAIIAKEKRQDEKAASLPAQTEPAPAKSPAQDHKSGKKQDKKTESPAVTGTGDKSVI